MPFTFSHPAIVLPFGIKQSKYLDFTTLVIGTMAPDFEYFIYFRPMQIVGHSWLGQLYFNLPIIIIIALMYHYIIKEAVIINLPKPLCNRFYYLINSKWRLDSLRRVLVCCYSGLLGASTHLIWDSFTHEKGFWVSRIDYLTKEFLILNFEIPMFKILQHGSTLIGFIAIMTYIVYVKRNNHDEVIKRTEKKKRKIMFWSSIIGISIVLLILFLIYQENLSLGGYIVTAINSVLCGILIMSSIRVLQKKYS